MHIGGLRQEQLLTDLDESTPLLVDTTSAVEEIK